MIIVISGPTGVGKTALSMEIAEHYDVEIISGDSMQVYKGMDIGTAKISTDEQGKVSHHMIDIITPEDSFSVADYQSAVRDRIEAIEKRGRIPLIVGGTGFYIKSVLHDYRFEGKASSDAFEKAHEDKTPMALYNALKTQNPDAAKSVHPHNRKRVLRTLEKVQSGSFASGEAKGHIPKYDYLLITLTMERSVLYERINTRVDKMIKEGLLDEANELWHRDIAKTAKNAIGYKELFEYFDGTISLEEAINRIKQNTRRFAKRQITYFKHQFNPHWFNVGEHAFETTVKDVLSLIDTTLETARMTELRDPLS
jgi:tRNA dimethylallyltransferase